MHEDEHHSPAAPEAVGAASRARGHHALAVGGAEAHYGLRGEVARAVAVGGLQGALARAEARREVLRARGPRLGPEMQGTASDAPVCGQIRGLNADIEVCIDVGGRRAGPTA